MTSAFSWQNFISLCLLQSVLQGQICLLLKMFIPDVQAGFRKGRGTRDQIANIPWIIEKAREFQKNIYFLFIDYAKAFDCVDHNKLWEILKEMGIPDHLTCPLRNLYAGQEATVRTGHGTTDVPNRTRSTSRLYIVTPLISLICRVHHEKHWVEEAQMESRLPGEMSITSEEG